MGKGIPGDFMGFTFNGVHSSTLGITRISNGSRYVEDLLPTYQDKVVEAQGADETFYFGSRYKQKVFNINFIFDNLSEVQIRQMKQLFSDKQVHELWFDETPYKAYSAKVTGNPQIKYVCFNIEESVFEYKRVYRGEGSISFTAFYPFAYSRFKYLDDFDFSYGNFNEWIAASNLRIKNKYDDIFKTGYDVNTGYIKRKILLWNAGDIESNFKLNISFDTSSYLTDGSISLGNIEKIVFKTIPRLGSDDGIEINTRLKLIQGYKINGYGKKILTSNIYNSFIQEGDFFKIPLGESDITIIGLLNEKKEKIEIEYKHWYI